MVPEKIELPQIAMEIFATDVVVDANESASNQGMATFGGIKMKLANSISTEWPL